MLRSVLTKMMPLHWRHNGRNGVSNHQHHNCLLNPLYRCRSKKTSKPRLTGLCAGNSPVIDKLPAQRASNAENISIWWRHHALSVAIQQQHSYILVSLLPNHFSLPAMYRLGLKSDQRRTRTCYYVTPAPLGFQLTYCNIYFGEWLIISNAFLMRGKFFYQGKQRQFGLSLS